MEIKRAYLLTLLQEEAITKLHDVGLVHCCHLLAAVLGGIVEGELGNASTLLAGHDLQTFNHSNNALVL